MASLTGNTIQSTYDSLLKVTDNDSITGSLKRITDGLGNNTPLYLSSSAVEIVSTLNVTSAITASNLSGTNTGDETKASIETKLGAATSSNSGYLTSTDWSTFNNKIAGTGTLNKLAKFSSSSSIADSTITDTGSAVTIGVATSVTGSLTASSLIRTGGTSSQFLKADGSVDSTNYTPTSRTLTINGTTYDLSANRSWIVGSVVSVGTSGPLTGGTITTSGTIGITQATTSTDGYLSSTDWNTFNNKQNALTLTTTGSSGSATLVGSTLNIPTYTLTGLGGIPTTRTLTINGTAYDLSADRSWIISTGISGSGTTNYLPKFTGSTSVGNSLVYDNGTNVGIGTTSPSSLLHVGGSSGAVSTPTAIQMDGTYRTGGDSFSSLKFYLYKGASETYGFGLGDLADVQYWAGSSSTGTHKFFTSQTERMRITSAGNVGIGSSSPASYSGYKVLEIADTTGGVFRLKNNAETGVYEMATTSSNTYIKNVTGTDMWFGTNNAERMRITSGGRVLIGTTTGVGDDFTSIRWSTASIGQGLNMVDSNASANGSTFIVFRKSDDTYLGNIRRSSTDNSLFIGGNDYLALGSGNTERVRINSSGNVGIGTTSPASKLHVVGDIRITDSASIITSNGAGGSFDLGLLGGGSDPNAYIYQRANGFLAIATNNTERMRITSGGNVGIGTSSPSLPLHIYNSGAALAYFESTNANGVYTIWRNSGTSIGDVGAALGISGSGSASDFMIASRSGNMILGTGSSEKMRITSGGNVGINTTSPSYKFDVNGDIRSTGAIRVNTGTIDTALTFDTSAGAVGTVTNHNLNFWINGTTQAKLTTDAQLYVGTGVVNASAKVQIDSTTKGFLPPRMTSLQRIAISTPAVGLMVYQTDNAGGLGGNEGLYIYKSGGWTFII